MFLGALEADVGGFLFFFGPCEGFLLCLCVVSMVVMEARTGAEMRFLCARGVLRLPCTRCCSFPAFVGVLEVVRGGGRRVFIFFLPL